MNVLQIWITMKVLVILLFFSGFFGMIRLFMLPDMSYVAMVIALSAFAGGTVFLFLNPSRGAQDGKEIQAFGHKLLGPLAGHR